MIGCSCLENVDCVLVSKVHKNSKLWFTFRLSSKLDNSAKICLRVNIRHVVRPWIASWFSILKYLWSSLLLTPFAVSLNFRHLPNIHKEFRIPMQTPFMALFSMSWHFSSSHYKCEFCVVYFFYREACRKQHGHVFPFTVVWDLFFPRPITGYRFPVPSFSNRMHFLETQHIHQVTSSSHKSAVSGCLVPPSKIVLIF